MKNLKKWFFRLILKLIPEDIIITHLLGGNLSEIIKHIPIDKIRRYLSERGLIKKWHKENIAITELDNKNLMEGSGFNSVCFKNVEIIRQDGSATAKKFILIMVLRNNDVEKRKAEWLNANSEVAKIEHLELKDGQTQIIFYNNKNDKIHEETRYAVITRFDNEEMAFVHYLKADY